MAENQNNRTNVTKKKMTHFGVGPRWVLISLLSCAPFIALRFLFPDAVAIPFVPRPWVIGIGIAMLAIGLPLCCAALVRLAKGFPRGELFTSGPYALCRHPIYASWIVFNVPGIVLIANNWTGLLAPIPMYIALRILVREEEEWLERTFGDAYREYRGRVNAVSPLPTRHGLLTAVPVAQGSSSCRTRRRHED